MAIMYHGAELNAWYLLDRVNERHLAVRAHGWDHLTPYPERLLTEDEVARIWGVTPATLRRWRNAGTMPAALGFDTDDLERSQWEAQLFARRSRAAVAGWERRRQRAANA